MAEKKKSTQMSLEEYNKIKEKQAQSKLKLHFPWIVKFALGIPLAYFVFLFFYFLMHVRFASEH